MKKNLYLLLLAFISMSAVLAEQPDPKTLVQGSLDNWRGNSSYTELTMIVHRPDWERKTSMLGITRGRKDTLVRFTKPAKDSGNATLKLGRNMWAFTPRLNQVIKLPASMMAQSWMGSDFSYSDLAKSDQILTDYQLTLQGVEKEESHTVYSVEAIPRNDAPVVWGKETLRIRDDNVLLEREYYDQAGTLVRRLQTDKIRPLGGRPYPVELRMIDMEKEGHWTTLITEQAHFEVDIPSYLFTLSNLRNPRKWQPR